MARQPLQPATNPLFALCLPPFVAPPQTVPSTMVYWMAVEGTRRLMAAHFEVDGAPADGADGAPAASAPAAAAPAAPVPAPAGLAMPTPAMA